MPGWPQTRAPPLLYESTPCFGLVYDNLREWIVGNRESVAGVNSLYARCTPQIHSQSRPHIYLEQGPGLWASIDDVSPFPCYVLYIQVPRRIGENGLKPALAWF